MKRAKIMLTAIAVLAVVGGALAFKVRTFNTYDVYSLNSGSSQCTKIAGQFEADGTQENYPAATILLHSPAAPGSEETTSTCTFDITVDRE